MITPIARRIALLFGLVVLAAFVALRFEVATDVTSFLPEGEARSMAEMSRAIADSELSRTVVVTLHGAELPVLITAGRELEHAFRSDPTVAARLAFFEGGPPADIERAMWELYHPRRFGFSSGEPLTDERLSSAADRLVQRLQQPMSPLLTRVAPSDPMLILPDLFDALQASRGGGVSLVEGRFVSGVGSDAPAAVLFFGTDESAFNSQVQAPVFAALDAAFHEVNAAHGGTLTMESSAIARYALRAETAIRSDIQRVSVLSLLGLAALVFALFRSLRLVGLTSLPIGAGVLAGCAATLAVYGRVHGITLAFGASLIGVAIDYVIHLYCHHASAPEPSNPGQRGAERTLEIIWPSLALGALTTGIGFVALAGSSFAGLREVAVFSVAGIAMALAVTHTLVPRLMPNVAKPVRFRATLVRALGKLYAGLVAHRSATIALPLLAVGLFAVAAPHVEWNDDFGSMQRLDASLVAEDERVRSRVMTFEQSRFVLAVGDSDEEALQVNDAVFAQLTAAANSGDLGAFRGVGELLPSAAKQALAASAYFEPGLPERLIAHFEAAGVRGSALQPFVDSIAQGSPPPLTLDDLRGSPLHPLVRPFRIHIGDRIAYLSFLSDVRDPGALRARIETIAGASFLDQSTLLAAANREYQERTAQLMLIGLVAVLMVLVARYRRVRPALAAFLPAVLGAAMTVAVLTLLGFGLDLVALTALLMVVSMGVDYGVFLVDASRENADSVPSALLSVVVACASTVLGFGLLALSHHPVLFVIGCTAGTGVLSCLVLAPTALVLLAPAGVDDD